MWEAIRGFRVWVALSLTMVVAEAMGAVVTLFVIGVAIDDYLSGSFRGLIIVAAVGFGTMLLATIRRLIDVRLYARVYAKISASAYEQRAGLSAKTARLNMLREVVDFMEYSLPVVVGSATLYIGTVAFLAVLSFPVFVGSVVMTLLILGVYALTTTRTLRFNSRYNDEFELQVDELQRGDRARIRRHIAQLNFWQVKLSDLDAMNVAVSLTLAVALQVFAVLASARAGMDHGTMLSVILYVFEIAAVCATLPESWQEYLRLREILARLRGRAGGTGRATELAGDA